jgi:hypothetical protein
MLAEGPIEGAERSKHICDLCARLLGVNGAGISMVTTTGNRGVVCATDEVSAWIEDLQFTLGEGVCVEAVTGGVPVMVSDLHQPDDLVVRRWPAFREGVTAAGPGRYPRYRIHRPRACREHACREAAGRASPN